MKLVFYMTHGFPHHKNWSAIQRMCKSCNIELEYTNSQERLRENNYDILCSMMTYIDPYQIPENIKIIFGPQFWVFPAPPVAGKFDSNLEGRCVYNALSEWIINVFYEMSPEIIMPIVCFPYSVDTGLFKPVNKDKTFDCIVYIKHRSQGLIDYALSLLNQKGLVYKEIVFGKYNENQYIDALHKAKFMLCLDAHESQGFALEEAMSTNVPLLVMDSTSMYEEKPDGVRSIYNHLKPKELKSTSVPYWSHECGIKIVEETELSDAIDKMMETYQTYNPRDYVIKTLSDKVCMRRMLNYFNLCEDKLFFDIGSNVGRWALANVNNADRIVSVEASPITFERLKANCKNDKIILLNYAVCKNDGNDITFYHANTDTLSTMNKDWLTSPDSRFCNEWFTEIVCKTISIDKLIEQYGVPELIKIDVEGAEYDCVSSLSRKVKMLCFEWASEMNDVTFKSIDHLCNLGFTQYYIQNGDNYTFRPQENDFYNVEVARNILSRSIPKQDWGMLWCR